MEAYLQSAANAAPRMKLRDGRPAPDHPEQVVGEVLLMAALGTMDRDFLAGIVGQLADAATHDGKVNEQTLNFMLSVVKGIKPRDQVETLLAAQMAAIHVATLSSAWRLARAESLLWQDCAERAVNKLARTFAVQTEALKRYRSGGEPNVTVRETRRRCTRAGAAAHHPHRPSLQVSRRGRQETLPRARRRARIGSAARQQQRGQARAVHTGGRALAPAGSGPGATGTAACVGDRAMAETTCRLLTWLSAAG
jgi:hypothetical protein